MVAAMPRSAPFPPGTAAGVVRALEAGDEDPGDELPEVPGGVPVEEGASSPPFLICASAPPIFPCIRSTWGWDDDTSAGGNCSATSGFAGGNLNEMGVLKESLEHRPETVSLRSRATRMYTRNRASRLQARLDCVGN